MRVVKKFLTSTDKEKLHDFFQSSYWDVFKKYLKNSDVNIMVETMTKNFGEEFHFNKGQIYRSEVIKSDLARIHKEVEKERKEKNASKV